MALLRNPFTGDDPEDDIGCGYYCDGPRCECRMPDMSDEEIEFAEHAEGCEPNIDCPPDEEDVRF